MSLPSSWRQLSQERPAPNQRCLIWVETPAPGDIWIANFQGFHELDDHGLVGLWVMGGILPVFAHCWMPLPEAPEGTN